MSKYSELITKKMRATRLVAIQVIYALDIQEESNIVKMQRFTVKSLDTIIMYSYEIYKEKKFYFDRKTVIELVDNVIVGNQRIEEIIRDALEQKKVDNFIKCILKIAASEMLIYGNKNIKIFVNEYNLIASCFLKQKEIKFLTHLLNELYRYIEKNVS